MTVWIKEEKIEIVEYTEAALNKARYDMIQDKEPFYAEVPGREGVYVTGETLEECQKIWKK